MSRLVDSALEGATLIDVYEVKEKLGKGGMAWVYKGIHKRLGSPVAIKVLASIVACEPESKMRFLREARLQHSLQHENIVRVIDVIEEGELCGIVMEWCDGGDLHEWFHRRDRPIGVHHIRDSYLPLLGALALAHARGIIHRDIKPRNVLLASSPLGKIPKLTDFGIAKAIGEESHTTTGATMGTLRYIAPEQLTDSKHVDHRADIYSFGAMLYFHVTGRPPFLGPGQAIVRQILQDPVPPPVEAPELLRPILLKCLAKHPDDRFSSCHELAFTLEDALTELLADPAHYADLPTPDPSSLMALSPISPRTTPMMTPTPEDFAAMFAKEADAESTSSLRARREGVLPSSSSLTAAPASSFPGEAYQETFASVDGPATTPMAVPSFAAPSADRGHEGSASDRVESQAERQARRWRFLAMAVLFVLLVLLGAASVVGWLWLNGQQASLRPGSSQAMSTSQQQTKAVAPVTPRREPARRAAPALPTRALPARRAVKKARRPTPPGRMPARRRASPRPVERSHRGRKRRVRRRARRRAARIRRRRRPIRRRPVKRRRRRRGTLVFRPLKRKYLTLTISAKPWDLLRALGRLPRKVPRYQQEKLRVYKLLCKKGFGRACTSMGFRWVRKKKDANKALPWMKKGCKAGNSWSCVHLGLMYTGYWGGTDHLRDPDKACPAFAKACQGKASWGCALFNKHNCGGDRPAPYPSYRENTTHRILPKFQKVKWTFVVSTRLVTAWLQYLRNERKQPSDTMSLLRRTCMDGEGHGCLMLSQKYTWKQRELRKYRLGLKFAIRGCRLGNAKACTKAAYMMGGRYRGYDPLKDHAKACLYARKGCELKKKRYCYTAVRIKCK